MTEEKSVGPVVDIRGTSEAHKRLARLLPLFKSHPDALRVVAEEAGLEVLP